MKSIICFIAIGLLFASLGAGCLAVPGVSPSATPFTSTLTAVPVSSPTPSSTSLPVTPTPPVKPTPTQLSPTPTPARSVIQPCVGESILVIPPDGFGLAGNIVYWDPEAQGYYLVGGQPLTQKALPISSEDRVRMIGFSPNGEWLAYHSGLIYEPSTQFHLLSFKGEKITFPLNKHELLDYSSSYQVGGWTWAGWLNEALIYVHLSNPTENELTQTVFSLLDAFTGEWQPDPLAQLPRRTDRGGVVFSPDLSRVLYVTGDPNQVYDTTLVLYDLTNHTIVWHQAPYRSDQFNINYGGSTNVTAAWSPDSSLLAYTGPEKPYENIQPVGQQGVFLLDREGEQNRLLTHFLDQYDSFTALYPTWSPNSKYLAFAVYQYNQRTEVGRKLYVYDTTVSQVIEVCPIYGDIFGTLVWSPDSRYLAYTPSKKNTACHIRWW